MRATRMDYRELGWVKKRLLPKGWQMRATRMDYRDLGWVEDRLPPRGWQDTVRTAHQRKISRRRF